MLKCEKCEHLEEGEAYFYCKKLNHILENGYAMKAHSEHCEDEVPKRTLRERIITWLKGIK